MTNASSEPAPRFDTAHPPVAGDGEGCLAIVSDRLRASPGVVSIEANFKASTLTVRYQPTLVATLSTPSGGSRGNCVSLVRELGLGTPRRRTCGNGKLGIP